MTPRTSLRWTPEIIQECASMYAKDASYSDIAKVFGINRNMVSGMVSRNRDLFPAKEGVRRGSYVDKINVVEAAELWKDGLTRAEIAERMGVKESAIRLLMERNRSVMPKRVAKAKPIPRPRTTKAVTLPERKQAQDFVKSTKFASFHNPELDEFELSRLPGLSLLENDGCMYALTEGPEDHRFCGHSRFLKSRYCEHHAYKTTDPTRIDFRYWNGYDRNIIREGV